MKKFNLIIPAMVAVFFIMSGCGSTKEPENPEITREKKAADERIKDLEKQLAEMNKVYELKTQVLQNELADYRLKLSVSEKTRLSLQAVVDQPERIANAKKENYTYERMVWLFLILIAVGLAAYAFWKYTLLRNQRRENINALIAEFTKRETSL